MKKYFVLWALSFLFVGFVYSVPTDDQIRQAANTLGVPFADLKQFVQSYQAQPASSGTISVSAAELIQAYSGNQLQAKNKYYGKEMEVTGQVKSVKQDNDSDRGGPFFGYRRYYVELVDTGKSSSWKVRVYVRDSELNKIANLQTGQTVKFVGTCSEGDNSYCVYISGAVLAR
jgi:hypothetical protein